MNGTRLRDRAALIAFRLAKRFGTQLVVRDPIQGSVTVWGYLENVILKTGIQHGETDVRNYVFVIPRQAGFPWTNDFNAGTDVQYPITTGPYYQAETVDPDNEDYTMASTFRLICTRFGPVSGTSAEID